MLFQDKNQIVLRCVLISQAIAYLAMYAIFINLNTLMRGQIAGLTRTLEPWKSPVLRNGSDIFHVCVFMWLRVAIGS